MIKLLLIDGDELLHRQLVALEHEVDHGNQIHTIHVNYEEARDAVTRKVGDLISLFAPRTTLCAFTGPNNFRKGVWPQYKANRYGSRKPLGFARLKQEFLAGEFPGVAGVQSDTLEADDVLGILATKPGNESHVLVSQDKDFGTVPCVRWFAWGTDEEPEAVTREEADRFHLFQTLAGDASDGYPGCPDVGKETAQEMLEGQLRWVGTTREVTKGARKGETEVRWLKGDPGCPPWQTVLSCYQRAGLGEDDALTQARLARILRWEDWDSKTKEVRLWTPT